MVEFALICLLFMIMALGLVDAGRAFYQYNNIAAAARYGARWGAVMGGTCQLPYARSTSDWCNQLGQTSNNFWAQAGNAPIQGVNVACPTYSAGPSDYYTVSSYKTSTSTTIVGAIAQRFDSSSSSPSFVTGALSPGLDLTQLRVCIELDATQTAVQPGDGVKVAIYYPFQPVSHLLPGGTIVLNATSQYQVE